MQSMLTKARPRTSGRIVSAIDAPAVRVQVIASEGHRLPSKEVRFSSGGEAHGNR
jgi:hypothetical protein